MAPWRAMACAPTRGWRRCGARWIRDVWQGPWQPPQPAQRALTSPSTKSQHEEVEEDARITKLYSFAEKRCDEDGKYGEGKEADKSDARPCRYCRAVDEERGPGDDHDQYRGDDVGVDVVPRAPLEPEVQVDVALVCVPKPIKTTSPR